MTLPLFWFWVHVSAVIISLSLFTARWLGRLAGAAWPLRAGVRGLSIVIDSVLLAGGVGLLLSAGWVHAIPVWLWTKWALLVLYVVCGTWALRRAQTQAARASAGILALLVAAQIVGAALWRHPAGFWSTLIGN